MRGLKSYTKFTPCSRKLSITFLKPPIFLSVCNDFTDQGEVVDDGSPAKFFAQTKGSCAQEFTVRFCKDKGLDVVYLDKI